jgi:hypothetical protein
MREIRPAILFDYTCAICEKDTKGKQMYPVIYLKEKIMICETCLSFIKDHAECSTYKIVKSK